MAKKNGGCVTNHGQIYAGQPIEIDWVNRDLIFECCDCSLVHRLHFLVIDDRLIIQAWRDEKQTAKKRAKTKAHDFDKAFDEGKNIIDELDLSKAKRGKKK